LASGEQTAAAKREERRRSREDFILETWSEYAQDE
jgi:hypothetical protein